MARSLKNIVVDSGLQRRMTVYFVAINFFVACVGLFIILREIRQLEVVLKNTPELTYRGHEQLASAIIAIVATSLISIVLTVAINFIASLYLSHRFAGPMKVINQFIDQMISGRFSERRQLRPNDELKPIMAKLHELAEKLEKSKT